MEDKSKYMLNGYYLDGIHNLNETRVIEAMRKEIPLHTDFCGCRLCIEDAYAFSLNSLVAHYVQTGSLVLRQNMVSDDDIQRVVLDAIDRVTIRPNHDEPDDGF